MWAANGLVPSGSGTTLPQDVAKARIGDLGPRKRSDPPPKTLALTQKTVVIQRWVGRRPIMAGRSPGGAHAAWPPGLLHARPEPFNPSWRNLAKIQLRL